MAKTRLDLALVARGLAESRSKAAALIMAGLVYAGEKKLDKAGLEIADELEVTVRGKEHPWVSRGGMKLAKALAHFSIEVKDAIAMDVGASTGGFTDVLLTHGAAKVYAVDVGHGQLDAKLRADARVVVMEETNARHLTLELLQAAEIRREETPPAGGGSQRGDEARPFAQRFDTTRHLPAMQHARAMRNGPTEAEKKLWQHLRQEQLGTKFRRQQAIGPYIADFAALTPKLVIELDGGQHAALQDYDAARTDFLRQAGYVVLRFWNHEVLENTEGVVQHIQQALAADDAAFPPPILPPPAGGGVLDLIVCDASFISLKKVLPAALKLAKPQARVVTLIKPQFEVGKAEVSRGKGVIRDAALHRQVCDDIAQWIAAEGWQVQGIAESPITGPKGNKEFLLYVTRG